MPQVEALVTPEVMHWARITRGYHSVDEAAKKIGRPPEDILAWENGSRRPTMAQARKAAEVYKRSLAVFYLPKPPEGFQVLQDFRRLPNQETRTYSPELMWLNREAVSRQEWLHGFLETKENAPIPFIGSATLDSDYRTIASQIRTAIGISLQNQCTCRKREDSLNLWIERIETIGIHVFRESTISPEEARGFVLCDSYAPFIFLNSNDAKVAQVFTLAHELAHLWLNSSGVSNLGIHGQWLNDDAGKIETYCNRVAGEVILPNDSFQSIWNKLNQTLPIEQRIEEVADLYNVSSEVVARRLRDNQYISNTKYIELREQYQERWSEQQKAHQAKLKSTTGGPSPYTMVMIHKGQAFTRIVLNAYFGGTIEGRIASSLLNWKISNFSKLASTAKVITRASQGSNQL